MKLEGLSDPTGNTPDEECFALMKGEADSIKPTLRDQFAIAALTGYLASAEWATIDYEWKEISEQAYKAADAMLKAREVKEVNDE